MTKSDLVKQMAAEFDLTQKAAAAQIAFVLDTVTTAAKEDGRVQFDQHIFVKKDRAARKGRNPQTGAVIEIPAKSVVTYKFTG